MPGLLRFSRLLFACGGVDKPIYEGLSKLKPLRPA